MNTKLFVALLDSNLMSKLSTLVFSPDSITLKGAFAVGSVAVIVIKGASTKVHANETALLLFPAVSVYFPVETLIVQFPGEVGVKVAVYVVPEPPKLDIAPLVTVISPEEKLEVVSLDVKVNDKVVSAVVAPEDTVLLLVPPFAVIVIVGGVLSIVKVEFCCGVVVIVFPAKSVPFVNVIVQFPSPDGTV